MYFPYIKKKIEVLTQLNYHSGRNYIKYDRLQYNLANVQIMYRVGLRFFPGRDLCICKKEENMSTKPSLSVLGVGEQQTLSKLGHLK